MTKAKLMSKVINSRQNVKYDEFLSLVRAYGFRSKRRQGSHCIFKNDAVKEMLNIQNDGGYAKPYQIKQFLAIVEKYGLSPED